ncbi:hypothetical protein [Pseudomonas sp. CAM1A]|uniref:hypothetical protein n=1 Tax=Pseudomonas sp. CAM1A TaxID=3231717 RepID=UPI0039C64B6F
MASIQVDGEDKTAKISDWAIRWSEKYETLELTCHFPSSKKYTRPLSNCRVSPSRELSNVLLTKPGSTIVKPIDKAVIYGERYAVVHYPGGTRPYVHKMDGLVFTAPTSIKDTPVFGYFTAVASARHAHAQSKADRDIASNVVTQLGKLPAIASTALQAYCTGAAVLSGALPASRANLLPQGSLRPSPAAFGPLQPFGMWLVSIKNRRPPIRKN